jgi:hypothetical protein
LTHAYFLPGWGSWQQGHELVTARRETRHPNARRRGKKCRGPAVTAGTARRRRRRRPGRARSGWGCAG